MQPRTTAILFVIAILLGAFVYLYEIRGEAEREQAEAASDRIFPDVQAEAIDWLEFRTQDDRPFESVRAGDGWEIRMPIAFPGDDVSLDAIASTIANLTSESEIELLGAPEIYGLGRAARRVRFRVEEQTYQLEIGANTPVGGNVYVARDGGEKRVFTVASFRTRSLNRDLDSLRDRRVLSFDRTRVERVVVGWPGGGITLEKSAAGWEIANPAGISGPADSRAVDDLLSDVAFLRAEGFVDEDQGAREGDVAEPYFTLRLGFEETQGEVLEVGLRVMSDRDGEDFLVRGGTPGALYQVPRARIAEFPRDVFSYRFKELSNFKVSRVQSFELVFSARAAASSMEPVTVRVDRIETGWKAAGERWVAGAAGGLIAEFARLEAVSVVAESAEPGVLEALGLSPPRVILRAYAAPTKNGEDGEEDEDHEDAGEESRELLAEVSLGILDPESGIVARARGQSAVFRLDAALAEQIPIGLDAYRARFLAPLPAEPAAAPTAH